MMFTKPIFRLSILLLPLILLFSSCELLSEELNECINKISPKLPDKNLRQGQVGVQYLETIDAFIKNADDDTFDYSFKLRDPLPAGLNYRIEGRSFVIFGTPTVSGTKEFQVRVELKDAISGPGDGFCQRLRP